jgi:hypothetical protein
MASIYLNPLRRAHITPERIDQGVDYAGSGPIYALGPGIIRETTNSGWPGGAFIAEELTAGPDSGAIVYYAENISPRVHVGQSVNARDVVGDITGGIEVGWGAAPPHLGESAAKVHGQVTPGHPAGQATGYGVSFNNLLKSLGAPGGKFQSSVFGAVPANLASANTTTPSSSGNPLSAVSFTNLGNDLISSLLSALGVPSLSDLLERFLLISFGIILILVGLWKTSEGQKVKKTAETVAVTAVVKL